jgi:hypothetical protein
MAKHKVQIHKQRSKKHAHKTKDRVTLIPLKTGVYSGAPEGCEISVFFFYQYLNWTKRKIVTLRLYKSAYEF